MNLTDCSITPVPEGYEVRVRWWDREAWARCTPYVGSLVSAFGAVVREVAGLPESKVPPKEGPYRLDECEMRTLAEVYFPSRWVIRLRSGPYQFEATADDDVEHLLLLFEGVMKFFAFKYRLVTIEPEVVTNREVAAQLGKLTKEDG